MYDRVLNQSRTSLTTNSSRTARIVRKRDSNLSNGLNRSRSKNKQDDCNTSFEEYLSRQTKIFEVENAQVIDFQKIDKIDKPIKIQRSGGLNAPLTLSQTLSAIQINRTTIIERGDRYIQHRSSFDTDANSQINDEKQNKNGKQIKQRKREPTPVKSKKQMQSANKPNQNSLHSNQVFELQLKITGLEDLLSKEKKQKQKIEKQFQQVAKDRKNLREVVSQMEMENKILLGQKKSYEEKIENLQKTVMQSQNNLSLAQSNLNKLRQTIKQNRLNQLQIQIRKLTKINQNLQQTNRKLEQDNAFTTQKLKSVAKQLEQLRKVGDLELLAKKQSMKQQYLIKQLQKVKKQNDQYKKITQNEKQKFLQQKIQKQQQQIYKLRQQVSRHLIKIYCLQNLKQKEISEIKQKGESQIKTLRVRYSKMVTEMRSKNKNSSSVGIDKSPNAAKKGSPAVSSKKSPERNSISNPYNISCKCMESSSTSSLGTPLYNSSPNIGTTVKHYTIPSSINSISASMSMNGNSRILNGVNGVNGVNGMYGTSTGNDYYRPTNMYSRAVQQSSRNGHGHDDTFSLQLSPE